MLNFEKAPLQEQKKMSREKAESKIESIEQEILKLERKKVEILEEINTNTQGHSEMKKNERSELQGVSFLEFEQNADVVDLQFLKNKKTFKLEGNGYGNKKNIVTEADMIADMEWGVYYNLDHTTASKQSYKKYNTLRYNYAEAYFDKMIHDKRDQQLVYQRLYVDDIGMTDMFLAEAYEASFDADKDKKAGFVFEKMISSTLKRITADLGDKWGMEYIETDVVDDVELKMDCLVKIKDIHHRAVGVDEVDADNFYPEDEKKGIQLTLKKSGTPDFDRKKAQVEKVKRVLKSKKMTNEAPPIDTLVLLEVDVSNNEIMSKIEEWKKMKKEISDLPGGPDRLFQSNRIVEILDGIFQDSPLEFEKNLKFKQELLDYFSKRNY